MLESGQVSCGRKALSDKRRILAALLIGGAIALSGAGAALAQSAPVASAPEASAPAEAAPAKPAPGIAGRATVMSPENRFVGMRSMVEYFPTRIIARSGPVTELKKQYDSIDAVRYNWKGETFGIEQFLTRNHTNALVVLHKGKVVHEQYLAGTTENTHLASFSMAKSLVGLMAGVALDQGAIKSLDDPVTDYVPSFKGTGYEGSTVRHLLQMSSGVGWSEGYVSGKSDINHFSGGSLITNAFPAADYVRKLQRKHPSGTVFNYSSGETHALCMVVSAAVKTGMADYLSKTIWSKVGMEHDAAWLLDRNGGQEFCSIGVNAAARDYARIGQLMLQKGVWNGKQVLPKGWVDKVTHPDGAHVAIGKINPQQPDMGYGYQWWLFADGTYAAQGVFGQFIWVNPADQTVIVKMSAWPAPTNNDLKQEALSAFRALSAHFAKRK